MKMVNVVPKKDGWYWLRACGTLGCTVVFLYRGGDHNHILIQHISQGLIDIEDPEMIKKYDLVTAYWSEEPLEMPE